MLSWLYGIPYTPILHASLGRKGLGVASVALTLIEKMNEFAEGSSMIKVNGLFGHGSKAKS